MCNHYNCVEVSVFKVWKGFMSGVEGRMVEFEAKRLFM